MHDLTRVVHHPAVSHDGFASLTVPTHRASTIVFDGPEAYASRTQRGPDGYSYGLHGTPTSRTLEAQLTALEDGVRTALVPSGQAAIAMILLTVLLPGDHVLIPDTAYPPVRGFCENHLGPRGIRHTVYDPMIGAGIDALIEARTRLIWVESPGSTTMEIQDISAIAAAAHARGALVGCDNTWATPLLFKPLRHGVDFSMQALTKYVGGHGDLLMGSVAVAELSLHRHLKDTMRMLGIGVSPDDCALALRGLETMGVRLAHSGAVALDFARRIATLPAVARVLHPALPDSPGHANWRRDFRGASGVFSVVLRPAAPDVVTAALRRLATFAIGASWGGTRSLIVPMPVDRLVTPWPDPTPVLRISVGLEDPRDLWADLEGVFARLEA
jgi:cystathionine beta-lyase